MTVYSNTTPALLHMKRKRRCMISINQIPAAIEDPVALEAFRAVLRKLFDEYPVRDSHSLGYRATALGARRKALGAALWACDSGVPNELILNAYQLIFTLEPDT